MRKSLVILAVLLLAGLAGAETGYQSVSVTDTAQSVDVPTSSLLIVNDGSDDVYFRLFTAGDTAADATTSYSKLESGESIDFTTPSSGTSGFLSISLVCDTGESATVRLYWE